MGSFTAGAVPPGSVRGSLQWHLAQRKGAEKKGVCDSYALCAGKHTGGFVLVALNFPAGPSHVLGGSWVWRAGKQCLHAVWSAWPPASKRWGIQLRSLQTASLSRFPQASRSARGFCWSLNSMLCGGTWLCTCATIPACMVGGQAHGGGEGSRSRRVSLDAGDEAAGVLCSLLPSSFFDPSNLERKQELDFSRVLGGGTHPLPRLVNPAPARAAEAGPAALPVLLPGAWMQPGCSSRCSSGTCSGRTKIFPPFEL